MRAVRPWRVLIIRQWNQFGPLPFCFEQCWPEVCRVVPFFTYLMSIIVRFLVVTLGLTLSSCMRDANPSNFTLGQPTVKALTGTYVPTEHTTELLKATGKYPISNSSITLGDDGSISIVNVPDWWLTSFGEAKGQFDNGRGTWTIDRSKSWWLLVASFPTETAKFSSSVPRSGHVTAMLSLVGQKPPYTLQLSVSDPNAEVTMQYQKAHH